MFIKKEKKIVTVYTFDLPGKLDVKNIEQVFTYIDFNRLFEHQIDKPYIEKTDIRIVSTNKLEIRFLLSVKDYDGIDISRLKETMESFNNNLNSILNVFNDDITFNYQLIT